MPAIPDDVKKILGPNEEARLYIEQKIYHPKINIDSLLITNERIILRHPHALRLKQNYTDYSYRDISNVILDKGVLRSTIKCTLRFGGDPLALGPLRNEDAQKAYGLIRQSLGMYQSPQVMPAGGVPPNLAQAPPAPVPAATGTSTIIEREVVKIRCKYCGSLNIETASTCSNCSAKL